VLLKFFKNTIFRNRNKQQHVNSAIVTPATHSDKNLDKDLEQCKLLTMSGNYSTAIKKLQTLADMHPGNIDIAMYRGNTFRMSGDNMSAISCYEDVLNQQPGNKIALQHLIELYRKCARLDDCIRACKQYLDTDPENDAVLAVLGNCYLSLKKYDKAIEAFKQSVAINPSFAASHHNLGFAYLQKGKHELAEKLLLETIRLAPDMQEAYLNLGNVYKSKAQHTLALENYREALLHDPDNTRYMAEYADALRFTCEWDELARTVARLQQSVIHELDAGLKPGITPFMALSLFADMELQSRIAQSYSRHIAKTVQPVAARTYGHNNQPLRIGYISPDFNAHAVGMLVNRIFSYHDRKNFHISCYYLRDVEDEYTQHIRESCDEFTCLAGCSDTEAADIIHRNNIDILVDLAGYTKHSRTAILAARPAPVQCHTLGYPGSMGADFIDYFITHENIVTPDMTGYFTEKLIYLPETTIATEPFVMPNELPNKQALGLPDNAFVFTCMNSTYRIDNGVFNCWMQILKQVDHSVLWLPGGDTKLEQHLKTEARNAGINDERLIFAPPEFMSARWRHAVADLWLDTFLLTAGTASYLAIWAGLPVLTMAGQTPQSRTGCMVANAANVAEMIVQSETEYIERAVYLARHPAELQAIRNKLGNSRSDIALFKPERYIRHLEQAYQQAWSLYQRGEKPCNIQIQ
jgi:predicted O-linked N-acetylglucosamine transferase (SPINDLY family)